VAGERFKIAVKERTKLGSAESRRLRREGLIPGVLYGKTKPIAIAVGERELRAALTTKAGSHAVLDVAIDGVGEHSAILKEYQRDKVRGNITHIDLQEVRLDQPIHAAVVITLHGEPVGVKEGGVLSQVTNEVHVEALPLEVPQHLEADVRIGELRFPAGVTLLDDPEIVIATVTVPTREVEPEVVEGEEGIEGEELEEGAEGAAPEAGEEPAEGSEPQE
jgi:large subunit ribosomal protein L25